MAVRITAAAFLASFVLPIAAVSGNLTASAGDSTHPPPLSPHLDLLYSSFNLTRSLQTSVVRGIERAVRSADGWIPDEVRSVLVAVRSGAIAPVMRLATALCLVMSVLLLMEVVYMAAVSFGVMLFRRKPEKWYKCEQIKGDEEIGSLAYPMVLVQIPMYNEKEVYKLSIGAVCGLSWPLDRLIVQVLDDSTDPTVKTQSAIKAGNETLGVALTGPSIAWTIGIMEKDLVQVECKVWASKGMNIFYEVRDNRKGYKAGALKEGMQYSYVQQCDYVAIFDADFQPASDFLMRTIPFLVHNPKVSLVQARWDFVNSNQCLMTRIQKMTLDYHFKVEQEAGSATHAFFGFNGTAGVWRISAINEVGGWNARTTVEDMDLAVRAGLQGWKFVYVGDLKVKSELPSNFKAYRNQQHRWTCGAANLFRKTAKEILTTKEVSLWKKLYVLYSFFFVRKILSHIVTFSFYCVIIPASVMVPEVSIPVWGVIHIPTTITLLNAVRNPSSIHLIPFWILFENVMAMHRIRAALIGLMETGSANEWVVTEKLGGAPKATLKTPLLEKSKPDSYWDRINLPELGFAFFLFFCACYDLTFGSNYYHVYIFFQSFAFCVVGLGYVGTFISSS